MESLLDAVAENLFWPLLALVIVVGIVLGSVKEMYKAHCRERTRREIAAYIAEGSITPDQGERLMRAGIEPEEV